MMEPLTFPLNAQRLIRGESRALFVDDEAPPHPLRLAFIVRGSERHIFPALALDDWGREKKGPSLYRWLYEEGPRFPRAELFGFETHGAETQIFLRDLELSFPFPCYVYATSSDPLQEGRRIGAIFLPGAPDAGGEPLKIEPPGHLPWPLQRAAVRWRQIHPRALANSGWQALPPPG